ncbi:MAG: CoA ester lyase [Hyphomicrobiaceae bacterium]
MSFSTVTPAPARLNRSQLFVLANKPATFEAAARSAADIIMFEIEDGVPPGEKPAARRNLIAALNEIDWGRKSLSVRINGLDTPHMYRDLVDLLEAHTERLDLIMIPKAGNRSDIYAVDMLVTQIETAMRRKRRLSFQIMIETAQGLANIDEIAAASSRNDSLHLGQNDLAASLGARMTKVGGANPNYHILTDADASGARAQHWGDMWHYAIARLVTAARAAGLWPVDGPFPFHDADPAGFRAAAMRAAVLGCEGKWATNDEFVGIANEVFSPSPQSVTLARRVLEVAAEAERSGGGVVTLDGKPIYMPQIKQARTLVEQADMLTAGS